MNEAARSIGIPCIGRNKVYKILKDLEIVDKSNRPRQDYVDAGLLKRQEVCHEVHEQPVLSNVTLVVGTKGLRFIKDAVFRYLNDNPMPTFPKRKKMSSGTNI